jgi:N-methylhydantoinase A
VVETREAYVPDRAEVMAVKGYDFERLRPGNVIPGPAIVWTPITTVVTTSRQVARCDGLRNLVIRTE